MSDSSPNRSALPTATRCCACRAFCPAIGASSIESVSSSRSMASKRKEMPKSTMHKFPASTPSTPTGSMLTTAMVSRCRLMAPACCSRSRAPSTTAVEQAPVPLIGRARYLAGETIRGLPEDVRSALGRYGIRNALLNSIAPTGTISLLADNVSSGIEPVFAFSYVRHVLQPDGSKREESVEDHAFRLRRAVKGNEPPSDAFVDAQTLTPPAHPPI